jgi:hypothetical protein
MNCSIWIREPKETGDSSGCVRFESDVGQILPTKQFATAIHMDGGVLLDKSVLQCEDSLPRIVQGADRVAVIALTAEDSARNFVGSDPYKTPRASITTSHPPAS